jgi:hypothetical protein
MLIRLIIAFFVLLLTGCSEKAITKEVSKVCRNVTEASNAQRPLLKGDIRLHDPSGIVEDEGYSITFATGRQTKMQASSGERQYQG